MQCVTGIAALDQHVHLSPLRRELDRIGDQVVERLANPVGVGTDNRPLIVFERETGLNEFIEGGTSMDAQISKELILSIFVTASPLHDGALIVRKGRITAAGCFLPLTANPNVSKTLGTRHRAAIGITEETDAVVVAVSEEDGGISLVADGRITRDLDAGTLRSTLQKLLVG